ncbi:ATP-binding protein [Chloroflexia bacterium SDU3-3]|nr:ATP-binding protein [Chloroflexia bacterium SDU3-3]
MGTISIVFGPQGAGKSTYARQLTQDIGGVHFSIDDWMARLYGADMPSPLDLAWVMERVGRCEAQIWATAAAVAASGGHAVLDLGFMKAAQRSAFTARASELGLPVSLHFVDAAPELRRQRVLERNSARGETFAFEVTPAMFDFMEGQFERPTDEELAAATVVRTD